MIYSWNDLGLELEDLFEWKTFVDALVFRVLLFLLNFQEVGWKYSLFGTVNLVWHGIFIHIMKYAFAIL